MKGFLRAGHLPTLTASLLHFETSFMIWVLMGGLGVLIAGDLALSPAQKGVLVGVPLLGGALARVPIGWLGDRYGAKRVGVLTLAFLAIPLACGWLAPPSFLELIVVGLALGVAGSSFAVALPLASRWYPAQYQGTALGVAAAGNSGSVLANLLAPRLAMAIGWQGVFGAALIPVVSVLGFFAAVARDRQTVVVPTSSPADWRLLREPDLWWFAFLYSLTFGGFVGFSSFLGIYFHDQFSLPAASAGAIAAACSVAGSLMRPIGGWLADRVGGVRILSLVYATVPFFLLAPMASAPLELTAMSLALAMALLGVGNGGAFQLVPQRFQAQVGLATGTIGAAGGLGGFILPTMMGLQYEAMGSYGTGFLFYAGALGCGFLCLQALQAGALSAWWARAITHQADHRATFAESLATNE